MAYYELHSPRVYVQGADALRELKRYLYPLGKRYLILLDCKPIEYAVVEKIRESFERPMTGFDRAENFRAERAEKIAEIFQSENKSVHYKWLNVEGKKATKRNISAVLESLNDYDADTIVAVGGGSVMDIARIVAMIGSKRVVLCPTTVATNASSGAGAVEYDEAGRISRVYQMPQYPDVIISDLTEIMKVSPRILASGIGDCLGTYYESAYWVTQQGWENKHIDKVADGLEAQRKTLYRCGEQAYSAMGRRELTRDLESIIALINYKSGAETQTSTSNIAHLISEMLLYFEECKHLLHGLAVGFGILPLLLISGQPEETLQGCETFLRRIGIPHTLKELGIENKRDELSEAAIRVLNGPQNEIYHVKSNAREICEAIYEAQRITQKLSCGQ